MRVGTVPNAKLPPPWQCVSKEEVECAFAIENWPFPRSDFWNRNIHSLGLPFWYASANIAIDRKGVVTKRNFLVVAADLANRNHELGVSMWDGYGEMSKCSFSRLRHPQYEIFELQKGPTLLIHLGSGAEVEFEDRASDINFNCLGSILGCHSFSNLAPSAWNDLMLDRENIDKNAAAADNFYRTCQEQ